MTFPADDLDLPDAEVWQPERGECDRCGMAPGEVGPLGICCACSVGQGASPELCTCGPDITERPSE